ncbi:MAG TPA: exodeoxyribonuclease V subunit gamma [Rhodanobacteraceae bacterium]|nr:exodeoxyribonuclease V subunit gamma [Rhodanobacteraceae bacterium]
MPAAPDFRLYHGNALDVLAELLARELRQAPPGTTLLEPDTILIPQPSMRRWLQARLAERHGIAANLRFLAPGEFVGDVLKANVPDLDDARTIDPSRLVWRLYAALQDRGTRAHPAIAAALDRYLDAPDRDRRTFSLASELAEVFTKYQAWRRDWLLAWDRGAARDDWQAELWRRATRGIAHRAQAIDRFLRTFGGSEAPAPRGLPARLFIFGCLNVSPDVLRVMTIASRASTVHFYLPTPSRKYWGDLVTRRERLAGDAKDGLGEPRFEDDENPLLAAWGRAGRDFVATLFSDEIVAPREVEAYAEPKARGVLQRLQLDVLERRAPHGEKLALESIARDRTLEVHACHTRLREIEVLHDQLRALFEDDAALEARDVAVMTPDIDRYAPYIEAVFGGAEGTPRFIPYTVADESALASAPVADLVLRILGLPDAKLTSNEVLDLIALPPLMRRFDLDAESIDRLRDWIEKAGARWGLDAAHRAALGAPADDAFTWRFALDRLLLGHAAGDDADIAGVAPWPELEGHALDALDALIELLSLIERASAEVARAHTAADWQALLTGTLESLLPRNPGDPADARARDRVFGEIDAFGRAAAEAELAAELPADVVRAHFAARFADTDARQPFLAGGVTFCRMVPMRLIPFRVICLVGLNDRDYPRREASPVLNRLADALDKPGQRRRGDRSVRDDDRFLFLQLVIAADRLLYLSYVGRDAIDGSPREPSIVVSELLDAAAAYFDEPDEARKRLVVEHPLQPFGKARDEDARRARFDAAWTPALRTTPAAHALPAFVAAPLPRETETDRKTIDYAMLRRFFVDPPKLFLRERLAMRLDEDEAHLPETEPFDAGDALDRYSVQTRVYEAMLASPSIDEPALCRRLQAEALLPPGAAGAQRLRDVVRRAQPIVAAVRAAKRGELLARPIDLDLGTARLTGALPDVDDAHALRVKIGEPKGRDIIRWHLDALALAALDDPRGVLAFAEFGIGDVGPHPVARPTRAAALDALRRLADLMREGLDQPLAYRPAAALTWYETWRRTQSVEAADEAAAKEWTNREGRGEGGDAATVLALRGAMPFSDDQATVRFRAVTCRLFDALFGIDVAEQAQ